MRLILPSPLDMLTTTGSLDSVPDAFLSRRGRNTAETRAGPSTLVVISLEKASGVISNAFGLSVCCRALLVDVMIKTKKTKLSQMPHY